MNDIYMSEYNIRDITNQVSNELNIQNILTDNQKIKEKTILYMQQIISKFNANKANQAKYNLYLQQMNEKAIKKTIHYFQNEQKQNESFDIDSQFSSNNELERILKHYEENENDNITFEQRLKMVEKERNSVNITNSEENTAPFSHTNKGSVITEDYSYKNTETLKQKSPVKQDQWNNIHTDDLNKRLIDLENTFSRQKQKIMDMFHSSIKEMKKTNENYLDSLVYKRFIIDSRKFTNHRINNYSFDIETNNSSNKIGLYFISLTMPCKKYNVSGGSLKYNGDREIFFQKGMYAPQDIEDRFNDTNDDPSYHICYDEKTNRYSYDKEKLTFIETPLSNQMLLTETTQDDKTSSIDMEEKRYVDFYINEEFVEKINLYHFIPFKIEIEKDNISKRQTLTYSFKEDNQDIYHNIDKYHILEFIYT
jgi:hypothetical protein